MHAYTCHKLPVNSSKSVTIGLFPSSMFRHPGSLSDFAKEESSLCHFSFLLELDSLLPSEAGLSSERVAHQKPWQGPSLLLRLSKTCQQPYLIALSALCPSKEDQVPSWLNLAPAPFQLL